MTTLLPPEFVLPREMLPADGRFGAGPSKVRAEQLADLTSSSLLGTSHRREPVLDLVARVRDGIAQLLGLPPGYEVVLGNGGSTAFWEVAAFSLVRRRAQHCVFGEFSRKFAQVTDDAPFLGTPTILEAAAGGVALPDPADDADVFAWPHNETSTGALAPVIRPGGLADDALVVVDATSAAGGVAVDLAQADVYYFAPQKCLGADGGLWCAVLSPRALERVDEIAASGRWMPPTMRLADHLAASRKQQTLNTPALATLVLLASQLDWLLGHGGLPWAAARTRQSATRLYGWVERTPWTRCFVTDPAYRSPVVGTVDLADDIPGEQLAALLRANGLVDLEPYRALGRNQLRVAMFPSVEPDDVAALTACVAYLAEALRART